MIRLFGVMVPTVAFPSAMAFTLHVTPDDRFPTPERLAVKTCAPPAATVAAPGETLIEMPSCNVTLADALFFGLAWLTAVTVTLAGLGRTPGDVYMPAEETVPATEFPPGTPFTFQVMVASEDPVTVARNCCVWPSATFADIGRIPTVTSGLGGFPANPHALSVNAIAMKTPSHCRDSRGGRI